MERALPVCAEPQGPWGVGVGRGTAGHGRPDSKYQDRIPGFRGCSVHPDSWAFSSFVMQVPDGSFDPIRFQDSRL